MHLAYSYRCQRSVWTAPQVHVVSEAVDGTENARGQRSVWTAPQVHVDSEAVDRIKGARGLPYERDACEHSG